MKQFYACEPKHELRVSNRKQEWVEYDIHTLICFEAECMCESNERFVDLPDDEFNELVVKKADEIYDELIRNGIYKNEFGQPVFLYC